MATLNGNSSDDILVGDINGVAEDDTIDAGDGNDSLAGQSGNDLLLAGAGNDTLNGGTGDDVLNGGSGNDVYVYNLGDGNDTIVEPAGQDPSQFQDTIEFGSGIAQSDLNFIRPQDGTNNLTITLPDGSNITIEGGAGDANDPRVENLLFADGTSALVSVISNTINGTPGNDSLTGTSANNIINGFAGNDTLTAMGGIDTLNGGLGNDTYIISSTGNQINENANEGTDTVVSTISFSLGSNVENLTLNGSSGGQLIFPSTIGGGSENLILSGTGNELDNVITGDGGNNLLIGNGGNDTLNGGLGNDTMRGGIGNDTYVVDSSGDVINENANEGIDSVQAGVNFTLGANLENLTLTAPSGGHQIILSTIGGGTENLTLSGTGNELDNVLTGNNGNNLLVGNDGNDTLLGADGNDTLAGGNGNDSLEGGTGNDTYQGFTVSFGQDVINDVSGSSDALNLSNFASTGFSFTAEDSSNDPDTFINDLRITSLADGSSILIKNYFNNSNANAALNGTGTGLIETIQFSDRAMSFSDVITQLGAVNLLINGTNDNDTLTGDVGNETLNGLAGDDLLRGLANNVLLNGNDGNDTYELTNTSDVIVEQPNEGNDTVILKTNVSYTLGANLENLTLVNGTFNVSATGNELDNLLIGNSGNNIFNGLGGNDTMIGNGGSDTFLFADNWGNDSIGSAGGTVDLSAITTDATVSLTPGTGAEVASAGNTVNWDNSNILNAFTGSGNDSLTGNSDNNLLKGGAGNDTLNGGTGNDTLDGGTGVNTYVFQDHWGQDSIANAGSNDALDFSATTQGVTVDLHPSFANASENEFSVQPNDTVHWQGSAFQTVIGGSGNDVISATKDVNDPASHHLLVGNDGNDTLIGSLAGSDTLTGGTGNDDLRAYGTNDFLDGGDGNDTYSVSTQATITDSSGNDTLSVNLNTNMVIDLNQNSLTLSPGNTVQWNADAIENATTGIGDDTLIGNDKANLLSSYLGNDTLIGNGGNDTLIGDSGNDSLMGGSGDDVYQILNGAFGQDVINDSAGANDTLDFSKLSTGFNNNNLTTSDKYTFTAIDSDGDTLVNDLKITLTSANANTVTIKNYFDNTSVNANQSGAGVGLIENIQFSDKNMNFVRVQNIFGPVGQLINGTDNDETLTGDVGSDTINAFGGNDLLVGLDGNDFLNGGDGNDSMSGGDGNDSLNGGNGNDTLDGGVGADTLDGGLGSDTYLVDNTQDQVIETGGADIDTVISTVSYTLGDNVENLTLTGISTNINATGNSLGNKLTGNVRDNILTGGDGNDTLDGGNGANEIDTLVGGLGDDIYIVNSTNDLIIENGGEGNDTVLSTVSFSIQSNTSAPYVGNVENLTLVGSDSINATGNPFGNLLTGNSGDNSMFGLEGNDTIDGKDGNDFLSGGIGDDSVIGGFGNDTLQGNDGNDTLDGGIGDDNLSGGDHDDSLIGGTGNDTLQGNDGNDTLDGGSGNDTLIGGAGNDSYLVDSTQDVINENPGEGFDAVTSSVSFSLATNGANVEKLVLTGTSNNFAIGNIVDNVLIGNSGNNLLNGGDGSDTLDGGDGDDNLVGGIGNDSLLGGLGNDTLSGDDGDDTLLGGDGKDTITGGNGNDLLTGGTGDDTLDGSAGNDTYAFASGFGTDSITEAIGNGDNTLDFSAFTTALNVNLDSGSFAQGNDLVKWTAGAIENLTTGSGADILNSTTSNNTLNGGSGDDTYAFTGAWGKDSIVDSLGNDTLNLSGIANALTINLTASSGNEVSDGTNTINWDSSTLLETVQGGSGADSITGDGLANKLIGNDGADTLSGGDGNDTLDGGTGNDTYAFARGFDTGFGKDSIIEADGTTNGIDTLDFSTFASALNVNLATGSFTQSTGNTVTWTAGAIENLTTGSGADTLTGTTSNNTLNGGSGNDTYIFTGAWGKDSIVDSLGNDTLNLSGIANALTINLTASSGNEVSDGTNTINWDSSTLLETVQGGSGADSITGDGLANKLFGNGGADTLTGGAGNDTMDGGAGDDTYKFAAGFGTDSITEALGTAPGLDTIDFSAFTTALNVNLGAGLFTQSTGNSVTWSAIAIENLTTGSGADTLTGSAGDNTLNGGAGDDTYIFTPDWARDSIVDSLGNDTLNLSGITKALTINLNATTRDEVSDGSSSINWDSSTLLETVQSGSGADSITGNGLANKLFGNGGADTLTGGAGNDTMDGGLGNDTYKFAAGFGTDSITEAVGNGNDTFDFSAFTSGLNVSLAATSFTQSTGNTVTWTAGAIENLTTGSGADTLTSSTGNNTLNGGDGNDTYMFSHNFGIDRIFDSGGSDTLDFSAFDSGLDSMSVNLNNTSFTQGSNRVTWDAGSIDNLTTGRGNDTLTGSAGANILNGGFGKNTFNGGAGNDTFTALGLFENTYIFGNNFGADTISAPGGNVLDFSGITSGQGIIAHLKATSAVKVTNGSNSVSLLNGSIVTKVIGTNVGDVIDASGSGSAGLIGNDGNDTLTGGDGGGAMDGGAGNDLLNGSSGNDTYDFSDTWGQDVITDAGGTDGLDFSGVTTKLTINLTASSGKEVTSGSNTVDWTQSTLIENATGGSGDDTITGNIKDNTLDGGAGNDILSGGAGNDDLGGESGNDLVNGGSGSDLLGGGVGNDTLIGGTGADQMFGDDGNDTYQFAKGDGQDRIDDVGFNSDADRVQFNSSITKENIAIFRNGNDLEIGYKGDTTDKITVTEQFFIDSSGHINPGQAQIERFELSNGQFMTATDINGVIQHMTTYGNDHPGSMTSLTSVENNTDLMGMIIAGWHN